MPNLDYQKQKQCKTQIARSLVPGTRLFHFACVSRGPSAVRLADYVGSQPDSCSPGLPDSRSRAVANILLRLEVSSPERLALLATAREGCSLGRGGSLGQRGGMLTQP